MDMSMLLPVTGWIYYQVRRRACYDYETLEAV
jgi:hypothetical protein